MTKINHAIMDMFPSPSEVAEITRHDDALGAVARAVEGCRAAIDEITKIDKADCY